MPVMTRLSLRGEYDISRRDELRADLSLDGAGASSNVVVDLTAVTFMDMGAIGLLIGMVRQLHAADPGASVELVNAPHVVRRILQISRCDDLFTFTTTSTR